MAPKFGTSGLRGLVSELTDGLCAGYVEAFIRSVQHQGHLMIGRDLRPSSARIAGAVASAAQNLGLTAHDLGEVSTPALALAAMSAGAPSVMVTGSHIPADRNGLKFYTATGEITKADEVAILAGYEGEVALPAASLRAEHGAMDAYADRYVRAFPPGALSGLRIGIYQHSTVARDLLVEVVQALGAEALPLGRSDRFIPVDTEAVSIETRDLVARWAKQHQLDAIISADGDADRPLMADADGAVIPGDILGLLTARALGAKIVVTPVSSNTMIEKSDAFAEVIRTRIGSPHVIAGMGDKPGQRVVGFEANGGFLLGFTAQGPTGELAPLMTRDALLPLLMPLYEAARHARPLGALIADLPIRRTASDRLQDVDSARSMALIATLSADRAARAVFFDTIGIESDYDLTDGLRVTFDTGAIVHLRPSGNAPELRVYAEANSQWAADVALSLGLTRAQEALSE
ncbi:MAG: phosphomannomutase [Albidovulum sp.]